MIEKLKKQLDMSPTQYHVVETAIKELEKLGYRGLSETESWKLAAGDKAYVIRDGSALIAFNIGSLEHYSFNITASHTDSPCLKLKHNPDIFTDKYAKLNVETYGGTIYYTWLDRPLKVAGRLIVKDKASGELRSVLYSGEDRFVIPSVAIHQNREVNKEFKLNPQNDLQPLVSAKGAKGFIERVFGVNTKLAVCDYDLYISCAQEAFTFGLDSEFLCAPRLDNQTSAFGSVEALGDCSPRGIAMAFLADNEEVGSRTKQGAGATFLKDVMRRINSSLGFSEEHYRTALSHTFMVSSDNSHALHPNRPELSDPTNKNYLNEGVVIKHHAGQSYTTDGFSSAVIKEIFTGAGVKYQDFYSRSDMAGGSTLGAISSSQLSIRSVDIGLPQLAMHSSAETMGTKDYEGLVKGIRAFYNAAIISTGHGGIKIV